MLVTDVSGSSLMVGNRLINTELLGLNFIHHVHYIYQSYRTRNYDPRVALCILKRSAHWLRALKGSACLFWTLVRSEIMGSDFRILQVGPSTARLDRMAWCKWCFCISVTRVIISMELITLMLSYVFLLLRWLFMMVGGVNHVQCFIAKCEPITFLQFMMNYHNYAWYIHSTS